MSFPDVKIIPLKITKAEIASSFPNIGRGLLTDCSNKSEHQEELRAVFRQEFEKYIEPLVRNQIDCWGAINKAAKAKKCPSLKEPPPQLSQSLQMIGFEIYSKHPAKDVYVLTETSAVKIGEKVMILVASEDGDYLNPKMEGQDVRVRMIASLGQKNTIQIEARPISKRGALMIYLHPARGTKPGKYLFLVERKDVIFWRPIGLFEVPISAPRPIPSTGQKTPEVEEAQTDI